MKRRYFIIFCCIAGLALGYTAYAASPKKPLKQTHPQSPKNIQENLVSMRTKQLDALSKKIGKLISPEDKEILSNDIAFRKTTTSTSTHTSNSQNIIFSSKMNLLNMYFNFIQNPQPDTKEIKKSTTKKSKIKPTVKQPLLISNDFVHEIITATSTKALQDMRNEFIQKSILHTKTTSTFSGKSKTIALHPAVHTARVVKKETATTTLPAVTPVVITEEPATTTETQATTTEAVEEVISTTTETQ